MKKKKKKQNVKLKTGPFTTLESFSDNKDIHLKNQ